MTWLFGIGFIVAIAVGLWLWEQTKKAAARGVNRVVQSGAHKAGLELTAVADEYITSLPFNELVVAAEQVLGINRQRSTDLSASLYIAGVDEDTIFFSYASRFGESFAAQLHTARLPSSQLSCIFAISEWTVDTGVVSNTKQMQALRDGVRELFRQIGAQAVPPADQVAQTPTGAQPNQEPVLAIAASPAESLPAQQAAEAAHAPPAAVDPHYEAMVRNPATPAEHLMSLAYHYPSLQNQVAAHPNAYPDLLAWISEYGTPEAKATTESRLAQTNAPASDTPSIPAPPWTIGVQR